MGNTKWHITVPPEFDKNALANAVERGLMRVEAKAKKNLTNASSRTTGQLRMSIQTKVTVEPGRIVGEVGTPLFYAPYVEYGTGIYASPLGTGSSAQKIPWRFFDERTQQWYTTFGQQPQLFMHRAWEAEKERIMNDIRTALEGNNG